jgi:hypothetical protein
MDTIKIRTNLSAVHAAALGLLQHGSSTITPTQEQWAALPAHLRLLAAEYLRNLDLHVSEPGWDAVKAELEREYEVRVSRAIERGTTDSMDLEVVKKDPRVVVALAAASERRKKAAEEAEKARIAKFRSMSLLEAYRATYKQGNVPAEIRDWLENSWNEIVEQAVDEAIRGNRPYTGPELWEAVKGHPRLIAHEAEEKAKEEAKEARKAARAEAEKAAIRAWGEAHRELPGVGYALQHGYDVLEILVALVTKTLSKVGKVAQYREETRTWDQTSWKRRERPTAEMLLLAEEVGEAIKTVGLPVDENIEGVEAPQGPHLELSGVCRVEGKDFTETRVVVRLHLPSSPDTAWTISARDSEELSGASLDLPRWCFTAPRGLGR